MSRRFYLGVDVGTGSARAAVFDARGVRAGLGTHPIQRWEPKTDFHEQSSNDIWTACGHAIRAALRDGGIQSAEIRGIGFAATCSLVVLGHADEPITVSPSRAVDQNVILWMDHRAINQAARINGTGHVALRSVGGSISPEMQMPKLLWLKEHLPDTWTSAARFMDLPDFLSYRATGRDVRSLCTTTCKWNYEAPQGRWDDGFFRAIGLGDLAEIGHERIGQYIRPQGERAGELTTVAASELALAAGTPVAVSLIDAHAGGIGMLGMQLEMSRSARPLEDRMALICGSSSCHMAVAQEKRFVPGVWGPYFSAMVPGMWLAEGGQSAAGTLIDHIVYNHARGRDLRAREEAEGLTAYEILNSRLAQMSSDVEFPAQLTRDIHIYPDFHGNRSPLADPNLRGMICGLSLDASLDSLAIQYLAVIQAVAQGTRHILNRLGDHGYRIETLLACGGGTKNEVYLREHADVTGCTVVLPEEPEAVLVGAAMLGAVACDDQPSVQAAMINMSRPGRFVEPAKGRIAAYHDSKWKVHRLMLEHQRGYTEIMHG
jgi:FGGY-family pentulose kinase